MTFNGLKNKAASAGVWASVEILSQQGIQFLVSIILARLLAPSDFGTMALLAVFISVANVFVESGFSQALIQRRGITDADLSSVFYFNIVVSALIGGTLVALSPWLVRFYNAPILRLLTWMFAGNMIIGSFGIIQKTLFRKTLEFKNQCVISLVATIISGVVGIGLAWNGYGVWSLSVQMLLSTTLSVVLLWVYSPWRPQWTFSFASMLSLFRFGSFMLLASLLDAVFSRLNTLLIGKFYSPEDLGHYARADALRLLPGNVLADAVNRVAFPMFSAAQGDARMLRGALERTMALTMLINVPVMLGLIATAQTTVVVLFGKQWLPCVPFVQILCVSGMFVPLHILNLSVLSAQGHSNLLFRIEVVKKLIGIVLLIGAFRFGVAAIAWCVVLNGMIAFVVNAHYSGKFLGHGVISQLMDFLPFLVGSVLMGVCVVLLPLPPDTKPLGALCSQVSVGAAIYVLFCIIFKIKAFADAVGIVQTKMRWG